MAHLVLKYPTSKEESAFVESRFYFAEKYLDLVRTATGDWVIWYLPKRNSISLFGAYVAIALAGDIFQAPNSRKYYIKLSKFEKLDPPIRAVSTETIYERGFAELNRKGAEQRTARLLPDQEFVNILADHVKGPDDQAFFSNSRNTDDERARKTALFGNLIQATRERIFRTFPQAN